MDCPYPTAQPPRRRSACESCHQSKVKCSGGNPCARCKTSHSSCVYKLAAKIGKPKGSRNKSTLRRLQLEQEASNDGSSNRMRIAEPHRPVTITPSSSAVSSNTSSSPSSPDKGDYPMSTGPQWSWLDDAGLDNIQRAGLSSAYEEAWTYSSSDLDAADSSSSSIANANSEGLGLPNPDSPMDDLATSPQSLVGRAQDISLYGDSSSIDVGSVDSFLGPLATATNEESHSSSPWTDSIAGIRSRPAGSSCFVAEKAFRGSESRKFPGVEYKETKRDAGSICLCTDVLAEKLCRCNQIESSMSTTNMDVFLSKTDELLQSCNRFLSCSICEKNSIGLCMTLAAFAKFLQTLEYANKMQSQSPPDREREPLAIGRYRILTEDEAAVRALLLQLTVRRWRESLTQTQQSLRVLGESAKAQESGIANAEAERGLWAPSDIVYFDTSVRRIDTALAALARI
ncbi:hypothetical protein MMC20_005093 [Loxospora ochrophaea]|nr:hypothetical protein [Loxospora ochrophaea]